ncbi:AEC family transporter [Clostridium sp. AF15-17LB]|nr:AEC family transporter [Clostridium sp. AF15-17LB]
MELSILLAEQIVALFLMMAAGYVLVKAGLFESKDSKVLSNIVVYVCSPCVVVNSFQITLTKDKIMGLLLAAAGAVIVHALLVCLTRLVQKPLHLNPIEKMSVIYSNSGNLIVPLVSSVLGQEWVFYSTAYMVVQTLLLWTHGIGVIDREPQKNYKKILRNPNIIAIFAGVILFAGGIRLPVPLRDCIGGFADMIGPASMLVIGMIIGNIDLKWVFRQKRPYFICFIRLIAFPLLFIAVFCFAGMQGLHKDAEYILLVVLLAGSAPAAAMVTQLAQIYNKDAMYASVINVMSIIFCIITMPAMTLLYEYLV